MKRAGFVWAWTYFGLYNVEMTIPSTQIITSWTKSEVFNRTKPRAIAQTVCQLKTSRHPKR